MRDHDVYEKPAAAAAPPPRPASVGLLTLTLLVFALFTASLALLGAAKFEHAAARKLAAPAGPVYDPATGVVSVRREAIVESKSDGRLLTCMRASALSPVGRVVCPKDYGAVSGSCGGAAPGDLLVSWEGTGWACPELEPGKRGAVSVSALCCKY